MTLLGKTLLFANLILSLIMAAWGLALYTGRIEWAPPPGKSGASKAEQPVINKLLDTKKELDTVVAAADGRYNEASAQLRNVQRVRAANREWYEAANSYLLYQANDQNPAAAPVLQNGLAVTVNPTPQAPAPIQVEAARDRAGDPLRSHTAYVNDLLAVHEQIRAEMGRLEEENKKFLALSQQIVGVMDAGGKVTKPGLRQLLQDEQDKDARVVAEKERLRPLLVNAYVEIQLLAKRSDQLKKQVQGLSADRSEEPAPKVVSGVDK